jgi:nucleoside-diphosphate-sugar epimerase
MAEGPTLITGARGTIGTVLAAGLTDRALRAVDLPEVDLRDPAAAHAAVAGCRQVIHLAWDTKGENHLLSTFLPANAQMTFNVLSAALELGVERVIFASSVHAQAYAPGARAVIEMPGGVHGAEGERAPTPDSPYGAAKLFGEALGRWAATRGTEVVAIRFGGVNPADAPPVHDELERRVWLSHRDCVSAVRAALEARLPLGYAQFVAVSNNAGRPHAVENQLGWLPLDGAA